MATGQEDCEKTCSDCKHAQMCVLWLKSLNYVHTMTLHELCPSVQKDVNKFRASFRLRRKCSQRLNMAAELLDAGSLKEGEFEELRRVDHEYRRELVFEDSQKLKAAVEAFGPDMQTIIAVLLNPTLFESGGRLSYYYVIMRVLEIADSEPQLIDFYFPQLLQVHLQESRGRSEEALWKVDLVQQALLVLSQKYPSLASKLAWSLLASIADYVEFKRIYQVQYAACLCLLLQLELMITGVVSSIVDIPTCRILSKVFHG